MNHFIKKYDLLISNKLTRIRPKLLIHILAKSGNILVLFLVIITFCLIPDKSYKIMGLISAISLTLSMGLVYSVKAMVKRQRQSYENSIQKKHDPYSFPSGHVARLSALIFPTLTIAFYPIIFLFLSILCGISRIALGYHYFFDCFVGFLIGLVVGLIALMLSNFYIGFFIEIYKLLHLWI